MLFTKQTSMKNNIFRLAYTALICTNIAQKIQQTNQLHQLMENDALDHTQSDKVLLINDPGRPEKPKLVRFEKVPKRKHSYQGLIHTIHAIAHIEFNAINIALDAVYRFQDMPSNYYQDWIQVAYEEAIHFGLLSDYLQTFDHQYGDFDSHNGLWQMCINTQSNPLERMALVPRVLEARGLDVTPDMIKRFAKFAKTQAEFLPMLAILDRIFNDEITHVRIGNFWFNYLCRQNNLEPIPVFDRLIKQHIGNTLHGNFNLEARKQAGFSQAELDYLQGK